ncbi:hypothetical protein P3X46_033692 [Hevea brasiliensis]|uniref:CASP-like protein n=1 Tax=Hevea brasiliensis TaxID=3981 RepID=A0ABQ9KC25_HEVBR|nr:hypothetical protein P3X46_033692 [Hevea brasiliensis]
MATTAAKEMNTISFEVKSLGFSYPSRVPHRSFFMTQVMFRVLAIAFTVALISVMVTSDQNVLVFGIMTVARLIYKYRMIFDFGFSCVFFRFLLGADAVVCGLSVLSLIIFCILSRSEHMRVMMVLLISGCSAATAIGYVGHYGANGMTWIAVCDYVGKFCNHVLASLVFILPSFLLLPCTYLCLCPQTHDSDSVNPLHFSQEESIFSFPYYFTGRQGLVCSIRIQIYMYINV